MLLHRKKRERLHNNGFHSGELLFIAIIKLTLKQNPQWLLKNERLDFLAEFFAVNGDVSEAIKKKVAQIKK